jgi:hypothetical protein
MKSQLSSRDWEYLSAYLDRQLNPKETALLEARLSADPVLSAALGELQRTRNALRSLPRLRAPRNFTLTPQMIGQRSPLRSRPAGQLAPVFGFASALATFLLILVVVGDVFGILTPAAKPVAQAPTRSSETTMPPATNLGVEGPVTQQAVLATSEPTLAAAPAETVTILQAPKAQSMITDTTAMSPTVEPAQALGVELETPGTRNIVTKTEIETGTITVGITETISAKQAAGMGGGLMGEEDESMPTSSAIITPNGLMWNTTISVTVSPTETLTFPMTVTKEGPGLAATYETGVGGGQPEVESQRAEPTPTAIPPEAPSPAGNSVPAPTETPVVVQPETQTITQAVAPTQTVLPQVYTPQPDRLGQFIVRIVEMTLALLALVTALVAIYIWWLGKI